MAALCCVVAFAAAGTAIGVSLEDSSARSRSLPPWVDTVVLAAGAVSALCAAAAICCQAARCCCRPSKTCSNGEQAAVSKTLTAAAVLSAIGLLAQATMLTCVTVYWRYLSYRTYYQGYGGNSDRAFHVRRRINYFEYYSRWSAEEQALYSFGCVAGCLAWSAALLATLCDLWASWQRAQQQQGDIPLTAALLSGDHLLPLTRAPSASGCSTSVAISALLAWPQEEASPRSRRSAGSTDNLGALLLRVRPT
ncbi:hypothetical protein C2E21_3368 [Chlorella sorokiniana]|uniref:Uncharacterized protein n=1 Tax=Chlorella sorokiniana TaxID=3076 RepID=A0A2P6TU51_CHLSO|nr:hypothetical protein C2E21_3368 [Chlorella sorokiniana]|eukprot:PRW57546.1 hypothetical protein C2E21_3368 [Chlorella sorokiniana]